ncbi:MAG: hypothetical protein ACOZNI_10730 [Myxococcota bacterium]
MRKLLLAIPVLLLAPRALAIDEPNPAGDTSPKTTGELLSDLTGESGPDRLYAARVLRAQLVRALNAEARAKEGSIAHDEARAALVELEARLPEACTAALEHDNVVAPCADVLARLDVTAAVPALEARLAKETRKGVRKRLEAAIAELKT